MVVVLARGGRIDVQMYVEEKIHVLDGRRFETLEILRGLLLKLRSSYYDVQMVTLMPFQNIITH